MPEDIATASPASSEVDAQFAARSAEAQGMVGGSAPQASEPLEPDVVNSLGQVLTGTISNLSSGQIEAPAFEELTEPVEMVPPPIWMGVATLDAFLKQAAQSGLLEAAPYAEWNLDELGSTNAGLQQLLVELDNLGRDKDLANAMKQPAPAPAAPAPAEPPKKSTRADKARELME